MHNIIDTARAAGTFKTLAIALSAADLVDTFENDGPFTVFAPDDRAFAKLPPGAVDALIADLPRLASVLTYHVLAGRLMAADIAKFDGRSVDTVNGADIDISMTNGVTLNRASTVVKADIECSNGVIHVIDVVLLPA